MRFPLIATTSNGLPPASLIAVAEKLRNFDDDQVISYRLLWAGGGLALVAADAAGLLWLREAKAIEDARPGTLTADDRTRLVLGLESVDPSQAAATP